MKDTIKLLNIIALVAVIGFSFAACGGGDDETHTHQWGAWQSNATQHWKECSCGEEYGRANHTGDPCSVCGYSIGSPSPSVSYIITGSGTTFTATKSGATVGTANQTIDNVITAIRTDANGANVAIQFGNGTSVLDIGSTRARFGNPYSWESDTTTWGNITLSGKITSSYETIFISINSTLNSTADIYTTATSGGHVIINDSGTVRITSGTISGTGSKSSNSIYNGGTVIIDGSTVSVTNYYGIYNYGTLIINSGTVLGTQSGIENSSNGTITINGGNVRSTSEGAIVNNSSNATVTITGGTIEAKNLTIQNAGTLNISGGTVSATNSGDTAIYNVNGTGTVTITSPPAVINGNTEGF